MSSELYIDVEKLGGQDGTLGNPVGPRPKAKGWSSSPSASHSETYSCGRTRTTTEQCFPILKVLPKGYGVEYLLVEILFFDFKNGFLEQLVTLKIQFSLWLVWSFCVC